MEVERNLNDAMQVARNVMVDAMLVPGGGAVEMAVAQVHNQFLELSRTRECGIAICPDGNRNLAKDIEKRYCNCSFEEIIGSMLFCSSGINVILMLYKHR